MRFFNRLLRLTRRSVGHDEPGHPPLAPQRVLPPAGEPASLGPDGRRRSVVFLHNSYYHFFFLAAALRRRGWDAISVSIESPDSLNAPFYHGEDVNLYDPDHDAFRGKLDRAFEEIRDRFSMVHFSGDGQMSIFPWCFDTGASRDRIPWDFIALKKAGLKIGYTPAGCNDGISQSSFRHWSGGMCGKCTLEDRPEVCSDRRNLAWGHKCAMFCDLIAGETLPALDYQSGPKVFHEPVTMCVDPEAWHPEIEIPPDIRIERQPGEVLIYHGVGNYFAEHYAGNRNVKGTAAVIAAVDRLKAEGHRVRLIFIHDVPSRMVRFYQAQSDIVVDQLNMGRYGANARESLMLGKPVVGRIVTDEPDGATQLRCLGECPIVDADEDTVYEVVKRLVSDPDERRRLGDESRAYALKWHSPDACAARFERVYDGLIAGIPPAEVEFETDQGDQASPSGIPSLAS